MKKAPELLLPRHLQAYIVSQGYDDYTSLEQATWRFVLRQQSKLLGKKAHKSYLKGLEETGLSISKIPRVEEINKHLNRFSWHAVCVRGFIPPLAFLEFQSRNIMPIAGDMRTLEHIVYTSAPDIVHEAAGHAPLVARADYRAFLEKYANMATKSFFSKEDLNLYEAIRKLSDMKENKDYSSEDIAQAERELELCQNSISWISEANKLSRFYWWTAEYGLVGKKDDFQIYGAGLLSSIFESFSSFDSSLEKRDLSLACLDQAFDITKPQPQLFVAKDFVQLQSLLEEFEKKLAFTQGGLPALEIAKKAKLPVILVADNQTQLHGDILSYGASSEELISFVHWKTLEKISREGQESKVQEKNYLLPFGPWNSSKKKAKDFNDKDLAELGMQKGKFYSLNFRSGFKVEGLVENWSRDKDGKLLSLEWREATVFLPSSSEEGFHYKNYSLLICEIITSLFPEHSKIESKDPKDLVKTSPKRTKPYEQKELELFKLYGEVRELREGKFSSRELEFKATAIALDFKNKFSSSWLLGVELVELAKKYYKDSWEKRTWIKDSVLPLLKQEAYSNEVKILVERGLSISHLDDDLKVN